MAKENLRMITNYIYFYHLEKFCVLPLYPDSVSDSMSSTFAPTNSLSRSAPVFTFSYSGPRQVNISFELHRDMMNDLNKDVSNLKSSVVPFDGDDYVDTLIKYLQSVSLPRYQNYSSGSKSVIPPMVALRLGNEIFIKGVVNGSIQCEYKKPILSNGKYAVCNISFGISETDPYDADKVVQMGSFRGISATFKDGIYETNTSANNSDAANYTRGSTTNYNEELNDTVNYNTPNYTSGAINGVGQNRQRSSNGGGSGMRKTINVQTTV